MKKSNLLWIAVSLAFYSVSYLLCRYVFDSHGMSQFPLMLFVPGLVVLLVSYALKKRGLTVMTSAGYIAGFALAMAFNSDSFDEGGGLINNAWAIWAMGFIVSIVIGLLLMLF